MEKSQAPSSSEPPQPPVEPEACTRDGANDSRAPGADDAQKKEVAERVKVKSDLLRQLHMVKVYRSRPETRDLDEVTAKWLDVCQRALEDFYDKVKAETGSGCGLEVSSLGEFIQMLNIDHTLVKFDKSSDTFLK